MTIIASKRLFDERESYGHGRPWIVMRCTAELQSVRNRVSVLRLPFFLFDALSQKTLVLRPDVPVSSVEVSKPLRTNTI